MRKVIPVFGAILMIVIAALQVFSKENADGSSKDGGKLPPAMVTIFRHFMDHEVVFQGTPEKNIVLLEGGGERTDGKWYWITFDISNTPAGGDFYKGLSKVVLSDTGKIRVLALMSSPIALDPGKIYLVGGRLEKVPEPFLGVAGGGSIVISESFITMEDVGDELLDILQANQP